MSVILMLHLHILLSDPLVVLFLLDLFHLVQKLSNSQLQLCEFVLSCYLRVVVGMFSDLNIEMNSLQGQKKRHKILFRGAVC